MEPQTTYHLIEVWPTGAQRGEVARRWATVGEKPRSEFLIAIIAQAIEDKAGIAHLALPVTFAPSFMATPSQPIARASALTRSFAGAVQQSVCYGGRMTFPSPPQSQTRQVRWHPQARYESKRYPGFVLENQRQVGKHRAPQGDQQGGCMSWQSL